jgi:phosphohistidine phosphatase
MEEVLMRAYLVHHGKAKSADEDPNRGLSDEGRDEINRIAEFLAALRISVSLIQHSGKARAEETAHLLAGAIRTTAGPSHTDELNPDSDPYIAANFLKVYDDDILIVGHLPHLERLTALLLTGKPDCCPVRFRNGGVVCLEKGYPGNWSLLWAVTPDLLHTWTRLAA